MFQRFHTLREQREGGFTLIELLVVILIIAILAAIAIPVFLNQRQKGWQSQAQSAVKNAATAAETYATGPGDGSYLNLDEASQATAGDPAFSRLRSEGFNPVADAPITVQANATRYCVQANHENLDPMWKFDSQVGEPVEGVCPAL